VPAKLGLAEKLTPRSPCGLAHERQGEPHDQHKQRRNPDREALSRGIGRLATHHGNDPLEVERHMDRDDRRKAQCGQ